MFFSLFELFSDFFVFLPFFLIFQHISPFLFHILFNRQGKNNIFLPKIRLFFRLFAVPEFRLETLHYMLYNNTKFTTTGWVVMARIIVLENKKIRAELAPDNGGMVVSLQIEGTEVLRTDREKLDVIPMLAGGVPVLFPYASKTKNDRYVHLGREFGMPFHGLVKNSSFGIKNISESSATFFTTNCPAWESSQYPFPFTLELTYTLLDDGLDFCAHIINNGKEPLPHAFGWHPYFKASDKKGVKLTHSYKTDFDYANQVDAGPAPADMDLSLSWDHVFHTPLGQEYSIVNPEDNYKASVTVSRDLHALVVCTTLDGAVCAEPWCGLPDTANSGRFLQTIAPGESQDCRMTVRLCKI